jgi:hypothetical protein
LPYEAWFPFDAIFVGEERPMVNRHVASTLAFVARAFAAPAIHDEVAVASGPGPEEARATRASVKG